MFQVDACVTASISGLTISGGSADRYGGRQAVALQLRHATLTDCTVTGNSRPASAAACSTPATLTLTRLHRSAATRRPHGGGLLADDRLGILNNCTVSGNSARHIGGSGGGLSTSTAARPR